MGGKMKKEINGVLYLILSSVSFGIIPILAKLSYRQGTDTYSVLLIRFILASLILLIFLFYKKISIKLKFKQLIEVLLLGCFGYSLTVILTFIAYNYISVGIVTMILYLYPAIVTFLSFLIYKEKLHAKKIMCLIISVIGLCLLVYGGKSKLNMKGVLFSFLASFAYAIYVIGLCHKEVRKINTYVMTFYISLISAVTALALGLGTHNLNMEINLQSMIFITLLAVISTVVALAAFLKGVRLVGPSKGSILSNLEPIVSMVLGFFVLHEKLSLQAVLGSILVISAIILLTIEIEPGTLRLKLNAIKNKFSA